MLQPDCVTTCFSCKSRLGCDAFYKDKSKRLGHSTECKSCVKARTRRRYEADREAWIARSRQNKADNPERARRQNAESARRNYQKNKPRQEAYQRKNRDRYTEWGRQWRECHRERYLQQARLSASVRRARMRKNGAFLVTARDLTRLLNRFNHRCAYCSSLLVAIHWDHILPLARGGSHSVGNLAPACPSCNQAKSAMLLVEWRKREAYPQP